MIVMSFSIIRLLHSILLILNMITLTSVPHDLISFIPKPIFYTIISLLVVWFVVVITFEGKK